MKTRFNSYDIISGVAELQRLVGYRVNQIYDIDNKTYLFRLHGGSSTEKVTLLLESGTRFHTTGFEWPKNVAPSGFSMKLRKHLKNKRLEQISQLGGDRIIDFQFGTADAAYHVLLELYDRGNVILTDYEQTILYILRPHTEGESVRFAVREKYPINRAKKESTELSEEAIRNIIASSKPGEHLRRVLMPILDCGPVVIEHILLEQGLQNHAVNVSAEDVMEKEKEQTEEESSRTQKSKKKNKNRNQQVNTVAVKSFDVEADLPNLMKAIKSAYDIIELAKNKNCKGFIIQVKEEKPTEGDKVEHFYRNVEFHPYLFTQYKDQPFTEFPTFMEAVDEFFSTQESQKIDMKTLQQEREALKKLSNVKKDHSKRLEELNKVQDLDKRKAELITCNQSLVDKAILAIQSAIASQLSWPDIQELVKEAQANGDVVASTIKQLKLEINHISLLLSDPYGASDSENEDDKEESIVIDVDLALSAWANARRYYDLKRSAAQKEKKTIDASQKALKSAERKTQQTLKEVRTISNIAKARKVFWFEKFYWFVSSENYLVIGGRDAQQNELIVKRYMRPKDIYVHADIQGASSVIIRNTTGGDIPPKTLLEAGTMAISYSVAWDAKVVTNAYWVNSDQVSKTAPTGEYLGTGSFMIRGKKNFLPSCHLIMGLSLLFKLEDSFIERHQGERKIRSTDDDIDEQGVQETEVTYPILDDISEANDVSEGATNGFPNTEVKVEHDTGRITVKSQLSTDNQETPVVEKMPEKLVEDEEIAIIEAGPSRKKTQVLNKKKNKEKGRNDKTEVEKTQANSGEAEPNASNKLKRGQKGKLKKMKLKYKDQDEEERKIRMMILSSSGKDKLPANDEKEDEKAIALKKGPNVDKTGESVPKNQIDIDENDDTPIGVDADLLDSLTGQPLEDDELLFAIPVVAPYQALQQYKFKVKLTPGTGKRGKAAKVAINMFSKDKACNNREKDLLKSIKEEALARNIPGKVKISAPQLQKFRK
ncbi:ribosome quality control complex subunit NEMF homolog [Drosophila albomicans]|uniref:Ribosome quality control complex subunit NEMF homolog n=1 Tax=Drosophila albomicans TaxID=7291 RepID=A0A6P8XR79_DROAB|nr:ribosome quality control complex subunit NEMF homolog [Drosophila albomicans]XP_034115609.1 ribosome quality control complex subunit NEMF homolog [Drosophila albomicans]XP_051863353.1 ribosome quality control complex subunit NEMF homolog [Drosophila albomicans]